ncbi:hypothetical protein [Desulfuromonas sp. AOP6]|uniref:hypothetical protein n=1 Tax=Desulfuromonas sp. AOP6 TaxID=1566351 RepID=UPI0012DFAD67|nr:hypothetical protein [Desulfuromonas sp. AOP6]
MNKIPTYVSQVIGGWVYLKGSTVALQNAGLRPERQLVGGSRIKYPEIDGYAFENKALFDLLNQLNDLGVAFSAGKEWCPSEVMEEGQERGLVPKPFMRIFWTGPDKWHLKEICLTIK